MSKYDRASYTSTDDAMPNSTQAKQYDTPTATSATQVQQSATYTASPTTSSPAVQSYISYAATTTNTNDTESRAGGASTETAWVVIGAAVGAIVAAAGVVLYKKRYGQENRERRLSDDFEMHAISTPVYTKRHSFELSEL
ncbi:unnamed protein product [Phytophthora fragariaefolia]|uniref:Unnamed protein product n=1 Tax=Phytophthora fragariaefolia TaxID=1490495 RepID=A0A9W6XZE9_9STRA|nr:unnamed protein product [Phytophthora fragariaefolia]